MVEVSKNVIGFANKYYTQWLVTSSYSPNGEVETKYNYIKNLSLELETAASLIPEAEIDLTLKGSKNFTRREKTYSKITSANASWFFFGKYKDKSIEKCNDYDYLMWYANQTNNSLAEKILIDSGNYTRKDYYLSIKKVDHKKKTLHQLIEKGVEVTILSHFQIGMCDINKMINGELSKLEDVYVARCWASMEVGGEEKKFQIFFSADDYDFKEYSFKDTEYWLMVDNGKGKKLKNKKVFIKGDQLNEMFVQTIKF